MKITLLSITSLLFTYIVERISAGCFHDPSEVITMCSPETKIGESLFVDADFSVAGHERCSCTVSQPIEGEMSIFYVVGSVFPMCRNEVNFYIEDTPIYNLNCLTTQRYSGNVKASTPVTFNVTGDGEMNICIAVQAVTGTMLVITCDEKLQEPTSSEPTTSSTMKTSSSFDHMTKVTGEGQEVNTTSSPRSAGSQVASATFPTATVASVITTIVVTVIVIGVVIYIKMSRPRRTGPTSKC